MTAKLEFFVTARRVDASGSVATCKDATLTLDTALAGRRDALTRLNFCSPRSPPA